MTATEVSRNFSSVLDAVQAGDEISITRGKKVIARLSAPPAPTGAQLRAAVAKFHLEYGLPTEEISSAYDQILADRNSPENLVGGEFDRDTWAK